MSVESDRLTGTVFIAEQEDPDDLFMVTGLFAGHLERDDDLADEFEDLPADEAIAWGRQRARVVLIRTGDSDYYSAGVENPERLPEWPSSAAPRGPRRVRGFEALDNTEDDPPVLWDVRVEAESPGIGRVKPFRDAVHAHPVTREVQSPAPGYGRASAAFLVEASTVEQARKIADEVLQQGMQALGPRFPRRRKAGVVSGYEVYPHRLGRDVDGPGSSTSAVVPSSLALRRSRKLRNLRYPSRRGIYGNYDRKQSPTADDPGGRRASACQSSHGPELDQARSGSLPRAAWRRVPLAACWAAGVAEGEL